MEDHLRLTTFLTSARPLSYLMLSTMIACGGSCEEIDSRETLVSFCVWFSRCPVKIMMSWVAPQHLTNLMGTSTDDVTEQEVAEIVHAYKCCDVSRIAYTREGRREATREMILHNADPLHGVRMSAMERAALDSVGNCGYLSAQDASAKFMSMCAVGVYSNIRVRVRQGVCTTFAYTLDVQYEGNRFSLHTPYCTSRQNAQLFVMVACHRIVRKVVAARQVTVRRSTASSFLARDDVEHIRPLLREARARLSRYDFIVRDLKFVTRDRYGRAVHDPSQGAAKDSFVISEILAMHFLMCNVGLPEHPKRRESVDILARYLDDRSEVMGPLFLLMEGAENNIPAALDTALKMVIYHTYILTMTRRLRDASVAGKHVNKRAMLGHMARGHNARERNTMAAILAIQEFAAIHDDRDNIMVLLEWTGDYNYHVVIAAALLARVNIAVDLGETIDPVTGNRSSGRLGIYSLPHNDLLIPLSVDIGYPAHSSTGDVFEALRNYCDGHGFQYAFIYGGIVANKNLSPLMTMVGLNERLRMAFTNMDNDLESVPLNNLVYFSSEVLFPGYDCNHELPMGTDMREQALSYASDFGDVSHDCEGCGRRQRLFRDTNLMVQKYRDEMRFVKNRAAYLHNAHYKLEWSNTFEDGYTDTTCTVDAGIMATILRNVNMDQATTDRDDVTYHELNEGLIGARQRMYETMLGVRDEEEITVDTITHIGEDDLASLAASAEHVG